MRDRDEKGRGVILCGEDNKGAKLTDEKVFEIRRKHKTGKYTQADLGKKHGVSQQVISDIINNKMWAHLEELA